MITTIAEHRCHGGMQGFYSHESVETACTMRFAVFKPPQAEKGKVPALYFLSGLTCTEENFTIKAGAQRLAAELGLMLVVCDTSPRGLHLPGDSEHWAFGVGAGFYLDATEQPWAKHYRMGSYVNLELPTLIDANFPSRRDRRGIFGHSMGGHGALITALRAPHSWHSLSALSPVCHPTVAPWGKKAFEKYLGPDHKTWHEWDASLLMRKAPYHGKILVDFGEADEFLNDELRPTALQAAAEHASQQLELRIHPGYDHSYWFVQSFIADHLQHHAAQLLG